MKDVIEHNGITAVKVYHENAYSKNTKDSYWSRINSFIEHGGKFPCSVDMLALFISERAGKVSCSTLKYYLWAIGMWHKKRGLYDPTQDDRIKELMRGIRRTHSKPIKRSRPFLLQDMDFIYDSLKSSKSLLDVRDLAILMIGFYGAFRRSEISSILCENLTFSDEGLTIFIPRSKTDQFSDGQKVYIKYGAYGKSKHCPVQCLQNWLKASAIKEGYVFRAFQPFKRDVYLRDNSLTPRMIRIIIKKLQKRFNIEGESFSGHSLRRGIVTSAARAGASGASLQKLGRWKNFKEVATYIEEAQGFNGLASEFLLSSATEKASNNDSFQVPS